MKSKFDFIYRKILLSKFFIKGWGDVNTLKGLFELRKIISNRENFCKLLPTDYPIYIDKDVVKNEVRIIDGHFVSPLVHYLPNTLPPESHVARFQMLLPVTWEEKVKPVCIHLAGTGDHFFWRRRLFLAKPLLKQHGIASIILENPYYGCRKPSSQLRSRLHNVSDLFLMGAALILESNVLLHWCTRNHYGPLGISGMSMGGHMASLASTNWSKPLVVVPFLSWSTASVVFTKGVLKCSLPWQLLQKQFLTNNELTNELEKIMEDLQLRENENEVSSASTASSSASSAPSVKVNVGSPFSFCIEHCATQADAILTTKLQSSWRLFTSLNLRNWSWFASSQDTMTAMSFSLNKLLDYYTHLDNYSKPVDPHLAIIVVAAKDGYIPREDVAKMDSIWRGAEVRSINVGHVTACLFKQELLRKAILDGFERLCKKYKYENCRQIEKASGKRLAGDAALVSADQRL